MYQCTSKRNFIVIGFFLGGYFPTLCPVNMPALQECMFQAIAQKAELKKIVNLFFLKLYAKRHELCVQDRQNRKAIAEHAFYKGLLKVNSKKKSTEWGDNGQNNNSVDLQARSAHIAKLFKKKFDAFNDSDRFNQSWEFIAMDRSAASTKLYNKEENTLEVFTQLFRENSNLTDQYAQELYFLLVYPKQNPYLKEIYKQAMLALVLKLSQSFVRLQEFVNTHKKPLSRARSFHDLQDLKVLRTERAKLYKLCDAQGGLEKDEQVNNVETDYEKAKFVMNQIPELRQELFSCIKCGLNKFLYKLKRETHSCFEPYEIPLENVSIKKYLGELLPRDYRIKVKNSTKEVLVV